MKTRLAAAIGDEKATAIYQALVAQTLLVLPHDAADITILFDPPSARDAVEAWLAPHLALYRSAQLAPQAPGNLGKRLLAATAHGFGLGYSTVTLVGTDCPELRSEHFQNGWASLSDGSTKAVFGPAPDGGYYLLALNEPAPYLFDQIPWSSPNTLSTSLQAARNVGAEVRLLEELRDIDTVGDLEKTKWKIPSFS